MQDMRMAEYKMTNMRTIYNEKDNKDKPLLFTVFTLLNT